MSSPYEQIIMGGRKYPVSVNRDGRGKIRSYNVHKVDIFRPTEKLNELTGQVQQYGEEWMREAAAHFAELKSQKRYRPPAHFGHHIKGQPEPKFVGKLDDLEVMPGDDLTPTLFASLREIPPDEFREMIAGRRAYRSIEVRNPAGRPAVSSLAVMATTPPHHKLAELEPDTSMLPADADVFHAADGVIVFAEGPGHYFTEPGADRPVFVRPHYIGGAFHGLPDPTVKFCGGGMDYAEGEGDEDDELDGLTEEELAELEAEGLLGDGGGMDAGDDDPGMEPGMDDDLDADEAAELQGEGIDMGKLTDALMGINQKMDAVLSTVQNQGTAQSAGNSSVPPIAASESDANSQQFAEGRAKPKPSNGNGGGYIQVSKAEWDSMVARQKAIEEQNQQFAEELEVEAERRLVHSLNVAAAPFINEIADAYQHFDEKQQGIFAETVAFKFREWRDSKLAKIETQEQFDAIADAMPDFFSEVRNALPDPTAGAGRRAAKPPVAGGGAAAPRSEARNGNGRAAEASAAEVAAFVKHAGHFAHYFSEEDEDPGQSRRMLKQFLDRWAELPAREKKLYGNNRMEFAEAMTAQAAAMAHVGAEDDDDTEHI